MSVIVTISREFGSGGREIGLLLAKKMKIPFYDRELITSAAEKGGLSPTVLSEYEEKVFSDFYRFSAEASIFSNYYYQPITDKIYFAQRKTILELAAMGPCVIVGRCSDYILKDEAAHIFIKADLQYRINRRLKADPSSSYEAVKNSILSADKSRRKYYEYYTGHKWGSAENYHLALDTSYIDSEGSAETILTYVTHFRKD